MNGRLIKELQTYNLKAAAFDLVKALEGGVYEKKVVAAIDLFTKLPCPETAANLVAVCPEALETMAIASDTFVRMTPLEYRGPKLQGFEEWMESFDANLCAASAIQSFLLREAKVGRVKVGFHRMRDQSPLYDRLAQAGISKGIFANRRQFLRDTLSKKPSAFRAVIDMICIHGIHDGRERFWNGLGAESDAQLHLQSEVMFEISQALSAFVGLLHDINRNKRSKGPFESDG